MMDKIAIFCSASENIEPVFFEKARELGVWMGQNKKTLVYGGANTIGNIGGWLVSHYYAGISTFTYINSIKMFAEPFDMVGGMLKSAVFGGIIAIVACYKGLGAKQGAEGVGIATTGSVVLSIVLIFITNYCLSILLYV